jgi:membrane protein
MWGHARCMPAPMLAGVFDKRFGRDLRTKLKKDQVTNGAAALAFYWMLALFPAAIFVLTLLPYLPIANLEQAIMDLLKQAMPGEAAGVFEETVKNIVSNRKAGLLSFGLLFTVWSASSGIYAVMQQLNNVHDTEETRPFFKARGVALGLTLAAVLLVVGSLALAVAGGVIQRWLGNAFGFSPALLLFFAALRWVVIGVALLFAVALVYHFGPAVKERRFALVTPGTVAGTVILGVASLAFKLYVSHLGSYDKTYGSLGAVIALLMWLFVTGLVLLVGAEIDVLAARRGHRRADLPHGSRPHWA